MFNEIETLRKILASIRDAQSLVLKYGKIDVATAVDADQLWEQLEVAKDTVADAIDDLNDAIDEALEDEDDEDDEIYEDPDE